MTLEDAARDLYGLDPTAFVAARTELAATVRQAGDRELAAAIGRLRKPTVTAWTVNLLSRAAPDEVDALLRLGSALRTAQRELSGDRLRTLSAQRQQVVTALSRRAGALAAEAGRGVGESVLREVGQTLNAALADPEIAARVGAGTLATAATYDGFGPQGAALIAVPDPAPAPESAPAVADTARTELDAAVIALESAENARTSARAAALDSAERLAAADTALADLRRRLAHAEQQRQFAKSAEHDAREQLRQAEKQYDRAGRRVRRAREQLGAD